jgi:hypothetical protein
MEVSTCMSIAYLSDEQPIFHKRANLEPQNPLQATSKIISMEAMFFLQNYILSF